MSEMILQAQGLCKSYGQKPVLHNVDLKIDKGDIYGLVGKNGAGKTTLMRIMTGLQVPTAGTIEYGFDRRRLGSVGALVELPSIYANKSAYENMKFQYLNLGLPADGSIHDILRLVGHDNTGNKKAGKFSLGMRQRLGIADVLVCVRERGRQHLPERADQFSQRHVVPSFPKSLLLLYHIPRDRASVQTKKTGTRRGRRVPEGGISMQRSNEGRCRAREQDQTGSVTSLTTALRMFRASVVSIAPFWSTSASALASGESVRPPSRLLLMAMASRMSTTPLPSRSP